MTYTAKLEVARDGASKLVIEGGSDGKRHYLEFQLPSKHRTIRAEWSEADIAANRSGKKRGIPTDVIVDGQKHSLMYVNGSFQDPASNTPWELPNATDWTEIFNPLSVGAPLVGARDLASWASCVSNFAGAGAGIGAAAGLAAGGPAGMTAGAGFGGAFGGAFGAGYCTAAELDRAGPQMVDRAFGPFPPIPSPFLPTQPGSA